MSTVDKLGVLFVCMGNICRSPAAESVFQHYLEHRGYANRFDVDSAGTIACHRGQQADYRMRAAAAKRAYKLNSLARSVTADDVDRFDLVIAMDYENLLQLESIAGGAKRHIRLLGAYIDGHDKDNAPAVPDPYYGGADGFERVLDMIESACPGLFKHCLELLTRKQA